jgi:hypothetical protein
VEQSGTCQTELILEDHIKFYTAVISSELYSVFKTFKKKYTLLARRLLRQLNWSLQRCKVSPMKSAQAFAAVSNRPAAQFN